MEASRTSAGQVVPVEGETAREGQPLFINKTDQVIRAILMEAMTQKKEAVYAIRVNDKGLIYAGADSAFDGFRRPFVENIVRVKGSHKTITFDKQGEWVTITEVSKENSQTFYFRQDDVCEYKHKDMPKSVFVYRVYSYLPREIGCDEAVAKIRAIREETIFKCGLPYAGFYGRTGIVAFGTEDKESFTYGLYWANPSEGELKEVTAFDYKENVPFFPGINPPNSEYIREKVTSNGQKHIVNLNVSAGCAPISQLFIKYHKIENELYLNGLKLREIENLPELLKQPDSM